MLQFLRNNTKIVIWFTILLLVGVFGVSSISLRKHDQYAGEIFGKKISFQEFRVFETMTRLLPPSPKILDEPQMAHRFSWQQLILSHEAKSQNIEVTDDEVRSKVDLLINGNSNRQASQEEYLGLLKTWHTTPYEFENGVREMIRIQKMLSTRFAKNLSEKDGQNEDPKKLEAETKQKQQEYIHWISNIYQRAQFVDYSIEAQKARVPAEQL